MDTDKNRDNNRKKNNMNTDNKLKKVFSNYLIRSAYLFSLSAAI